ncbi:MAG: hypothetical protein VKK59_02210 [Vampirovibrionales bacterium]|nr:hypothetical protein [Vampirovibrionales bacterium]
MSTKQRQHTRWSDYQGACSLQDDTPDFKSLSKHQKESLKQWLKTYKNNEIGLIEALQQSDTPVSNIASTSPRLERVLIALFKFLGFQPGFISPAAKHWAFRLLCLCLGVSLQRASQHGLFWLTRSQFKKPSMSFLIHHCYHWTAFKAGLSGYTPKAQSLYNKFWGQHQGFVSQSLLQVNHGLLRQLQSAIRRDIEALQLVSDLAIQGV